MFMRTEKVLLTLRSSVMVATLYIFEKILKFFKGVKGVF